MDRKFLTKSRFAELVEQRVKSDKMTYMDAVIAVCEEHDIDLEEVKKFISPVIKGKLEAEAQRLNFIPRQGDGELPV